MARPAGYPLNRAAWDDVLRLAGLNLPAVADIADIPQPTLRGLYGGHRNASVPMAYKIANAVGCKAETLFPGLIPERQAA